MINKDKRQKTAMKELRGLKKLDSLNFIHNENTKKRYRRHQSIF